jgi:hypothetical protein
MGAQMNLQTFLTKLQQDWPTRTVIQPPRADFPVKSSPLTKLYKVADSINSPFAVIESSETFARGETLFDNFRAFGGTDLLMFLVPADAKENSPVYAWDSESRTPVEEWGYESVESMLLDLYADFLESSSPCRLHLTDAPPTAKVSLISAFRKLTGVNLSEAKEQVSKLPLRIESNVATAFPFLEILRGVGCVAFLEKDF